MTHATDNDNLLFVVPILHNNTIVLADTYRYFITFQIIYNRILLKDYLISLVYFEIHQSVILILTQIEVHTIM